MASSFSSDHQGRDRNRQHVVLFLDDDVGRGRKAGLQRQRGVIQGNDGLEILGFGRVLLAGLTEVMAELPTSVTAAVHDLAGDGVHGDLGPFAGLHLDHVGLVDQHFGFHDRKIGDGQEHGAGIVHGADDGHFALLDLQAGDDAVDGRNDGGFADGVAGAFQRGPGLLDAVQVGFLVGLGYLELDAGVLELFLGNQPFVEELLAPVQVTAGPFSNWPPGRSGRPGTRR